MLTPWAGILTLVCCPVLLLWALRRRQGWLALSALTVALVPLCSLPLPDGWYLRFVWANWFASGASLIAVGFPVIWISIWKASLGVLLGLALIFAGLAFRQGGAGKRWAALPAFAALIAGTHLLSML
ncbi:hypothetical protein [Deinococcus marmoris]|uniref:Uncharacterized protein n=1 Tax=Deinococcus marmoris TaxID=249408 RepID=A0A1U7NT22_9DEIO|nr:hypothetical protein [Deinococcus marmoris]OLV16068.1 hypothetical protein BOO71_0012883 [Deinococcus marmoris]